MGIWDGLPPCLRGTVGRSVAGVGTAEQQAGSGAAGSYSFVKVQVQINLGGSYSHSRGRGGEPWAGKAGRPPSGTLLHCSFLAESYKMGQTGRSHSLCARGPSLESSGAQGTAVPGGDVGGDVGGDAGRAAQRPSCGRSGHQSHAGSLYFTGAGNRCPGRERAVCCHGVCWGAVGHQLSESYIHAPPDPVETPPWPTRADARWCSRWRRPVWELLWDGRGSQAAVRARPPVRRRCRGQARCAVGCVAQTRVRCCFRSCTHARSGRLGPGSHGASGRGPGRLGMGEGRR